MKIHFKEKQKFTQWWLWLILIGLGSIAAYGVVQQLFFGIEFGSKPMSDIGVIIFAIGIFGFIYFFRYMTLITKINENGIEMQFVPFVKKEVKWNEIKIR